ncbi:hypothetical protein RRG08_058746 [Elysia crispata]|uniref:Ig-like domain-containing protein n=1 Tax=Elysia crispata TaxID=231223 RepID=A0AAE1D5V5_9GAST|nr:hypothetical protein RRG08_058746 [Elysia crispata]
MHSHHPDFRLTPRYYTVTAGQTAVLQCAVVNVEGKKVIWKKANSFEPLTVDLESFYNTDRIRVKQPNRHQWNLIIDNTSREDAGMYECQISSKQKNLREHFQLTVNEKIVDTTHMPREGIVVTGTPYVDMGGNIELICNATGRDHSPSSIDWFLNGNKLTTRGSKVAIKEHVAVTSRTVVSFLYVTDAQLSDGGNYVCRTSDLLIKSFTVTVLNTNKFNYKRGTIAGERDTNSAHDKRDPGRQDGLSSDDENSARRASAAAGRHVVLCLLIVLAVLRHHLFPR